MLRTFTIRSELPVSAENFWATQSLAAVNEELRPLYRMTAPPAVLRAPISEWAKHSHALKSWILFRGVIPVDRHLFGVIEFTAPTAFVETSSSWLNKLWRHERTVGKTPGGCEVVDTISFKSNDRAHLACNITTPRSTCKSLFQARLFRLTNSLVRELCAALGLPERFGNQTLKSHNPSRDFSSIFF